jgi:hypothetical protein
VKNEKSIIQKSITILKLNPMAHSTENNFFRGFSGKFDNMVIKHRGDMTIISKLPAKSTKKPSEAQEKVKENFRAASEYIKYLLADPKQRSRYEDLAEKQGMTVHVFLMKYLLEDKGKRLNALKADFKSQLLKSKPKKHTNKFLPVGHPCQ